MPPSHLTTDQQFFTTQSKDRPNSVAVVTTKDAVYESVKAGTFSQEETTALQKTTRLTSILRANDEGTQQTTNPNLIDTDNETFPSAGRRPMSAQSDDVTDSYDDVVVTGAQMTAAHRFEATSSSRVAPTRGSYGGLSVTMNSPTIRRSPAQMTGLFVTEDSTQTDNSSLTTQRGFIVSDGGADGSWNLLWMPYVLLTVSLVFLLLASFARFHCKNRDRYRKRMGDLTLVSHNTHMNGAYSTVRQVSRARIIYNTNSYSGRGLFDTEMTDAEKSIVMASLSPLQDGVSIAAANAQFREHGATIGLPLPNGAMNSSRVSRGTEPGTSSSTSASTVDETKWVAMRKTNSGFFNVRGGRGSSQGASAAAPASAIIPQWRTTMNDKWRAKKSRKPISSWGSSGGGRTQTRVKMGRL